MDQFTKELLKNMDAAEKLGCRMVKFRQTAEKYGGVETAKEYLRKNRFSDGFDLLAEQGRLRLPDALEQRLADLQKDFTGQIKNLLSEKWTIKPESFSDKEEVKDFYQKIKNQTGQLQEPD